MASSELLIVAGEASGDQHAARLLAELRRMVPDIKAFGMGGDELRAEGFEAIADAKDIAVVGLTEALRVVPRARRHFHRLLEEVDRRGVRTAVLVDSPEFNLRLAKQLAKRGVRVVYYVSPQVWAWRRGRVRAIARDVERMLVLFPFEKSFYEEHGVKVRLVGHPLVDDVPELPHIWDEAESVPDEFQVALLPGSRESELSHLLGPMLEAAARLSERLPVRFRIIRARTVSRESIEAALAGSGVRGSIVESERFSTIANSHLAICASGTATLEVGLLGTPMIVVYRVTLGSEILGRMVLDLPHISLVNLVLGRAAVPELVQRGSHPRGVASEAAAILQDASRVRSMRESLSELRPALGASGASAKAAAEVADALAASAREVGA